MTDDKFDCPYCNDELDPAELHDVKDAVENMERCPICGYDPTEGHAMTESKIIPMLRNYMGDDVTAASCDAEWFRVEIRGLWLGDFPTSTDANAAFSAAHFGRFPAGILPDYSARIMAALAHDSERVNETN